MAKALERLDALPALTESRDRLLALLDTERPSVAAIVSTVESDLALVISVLRLANQHSRGRGRIATVPDAVAALTPEGVEMLASRIAVVDFFEHAPGWGVPPEQVRLHAIAVQRAADRIAREAGWRNRDELLVAALLHDIGKLVLTDASPGYPEQVHGGARTPDERIRAERHALGLDHADVGGVLLRRWRLPESIAQAVEHHHDPETHHPAAAVVRLADMLAHYSLGSPVSSTELLRAARAVGFGPGELRTVLYDLPYPSSARPRAVEPCPLSTRELEVLKRLAQGMVYKQIAHELSLSTSTVRTHLHNIYGKLGAVDRAQAVLYATERGWL
jgi:putative nucleotidyltransferase with HDIG domain